MYYTLKASVAQLDAHPTGDQEVSGSIPAETANFFRADLIMKYFLQSFSPFRRCKKGSCKTSTLNRTFSCMAKL